MKNENEATTRPARLGDVIHLPGGEPVRVINAFAADYSSNTRDPRHDVRCGVLIVEAVA